MTTDENGDCTGCGGHGCPDCMNDEREPEPCDNCGSKTGDACPECYRGEMDDDGFPVREAAFREPGGHSALRVGKRIHPCPGCGRKNMLTQADKDRHYQCDSCADKAEGRGYGHGEY